MTIYMRVGEEGKAYYMINGERWQKRSERARGEHTPLLSVCVGGGAPTGRF